MRFCGAMPRPLPLALLLVAGVHGFYLPGVAVHEYAQDERVDIKVNKLKTGRWSRHEDIKKSRPPSCQTANYRQQPPLNWVPLIGGR